MKKEKALKILSEMLGNEMSRLVHGPDDDEEQKRTKDKIEAIKLGMFAIYTNKNLK